MARTTAPLDLIASDLVLIPAVRGQAGETKPLTVAQEDVVWIEEESNHGAVIAEQPRRSSAVASTERP